MKRLFTAISLALALVMVSIALVMTATTFAFGYELSGQVSAEGRAFTSEALLPEQEANNVSLSLASELYHEWENGSSVIFAPFFRLDSADTERTHFDIREFNYLLLGQSWEFRLGIGKVFWGVTEFSHLVDIVNQTDLVESIDGEEKLGQPMLHLSLPRDKGTLDLFVLPYFRERTFPGSNGRLRSALVVDTDNALFESSREEQHIDYALRYSHSMGEWDVGLSYFNGTSREPTLQPGIDGNGNPILIPLYEQIKQTGLDLQLIAGGWLLKMETIYRTGLGSDDYLAADTGFEYTFYGIFGSSIDMGVLSEYLYDDRGDAATTPYENDLATAFRLAFNDLNGTEALIGFIQDTDTSARVLSVEASRRFGSNIKATLDAYAFIGLPASDPLYSMRDDDFVRLEVEWYF